MANGNPVKKTKQLILIALVIAVVALIAFFVFRKDEGARLSKTFRLYIERADQALIGDSLETALQLYFDAFDIDDRVPFIYGKISETYFFAGIKHKQLKNFDMYQQMIGQAIYYHELGSAKFPDEPYFLYNRGLLAMERKQTDSAIADMAAAYQKGLRTFFLHLYLADLYNEKEETALCIRQLEEAAQFKADDERVLFNLGEAYFRTGNYSRAVKMHTRLIELNPESVDYKAIYAASIWKNGDVKKAKAIFNQILEDPNILQLMRHHVVAWILIDRDLDYDWGIRVAHATADTKKDITSFDILGWGYYKKGDYPNAVRYLQLAYELRPGADIKQRLEMAKAKLK